MQKPARSKGALVKRENFSFITPFQGLCFILLLTQGDALGYWILPTSGL